MRHGIIPSRVTDLERIVIDGINDFGKSGGIEELLRCIEMVPFLDAWKLTGYLLNYKKVILYQKVGYILGHFKEPLKLPDDFFTTCQDKVSQTKRYLYPSLKREPHVLDKDWALYVPENLLTLTQKGKKM